jgi:hypothetical protein
VSALHHFYDISGKTFSQFLEFETFFVAAAAKLDYKIYVIR